MLAYDNIWTREPRLMMPRQRPIGNVRVAVPGKPLWASAFYQGTRNGLPFSATPNLTYLTWAAAVGLRVTGSQNNAATVAANDFIAPGTGDWTFLVDVTRGTNATYEYIAGGSYSTGIGFFIRNQSKSLNWGVLLKAVLEGSGEVLAENTRYRLGWSRIGGTAHMARDGRYVTSAALADPGGTSLTEFMVNSYDAPGSGSGLNTGSIYHAIVMTDKGASPGELAALTADSSLWWKPA